MVFLRPLVRYADFKGRARRSEYWGFFLFQSVIGGLFGGMAFLSLANKDAAVGGSGFMLGVALAGLAALVFAIPQLAVTVRRLHDSGKSAWWLLLQAPGALSPFLFLGAIAGAGLHAGQGSEEAVAAIMSAVAGGLLMLALGGFCNMILLGMMWMPGTPGENRFGPDPRDPEGRSHSLAPSYGGLSEDRLDEIFAQARREALPVSAEARWRPEFDFGPEPEPAGRQPTMREAMAEWPDEIAASTFGKRGL